MMMEVKISIWNCINFWAILGDDNFWLDSGGLYGNIDGNTLLLECVELLLDIINNQTKFYTFKKQDNSINLKSFDEEISFYSRIMYDFSSFISIAKKKEKYIQKLWSPS